MGEEFCLFCVVFRLPQRSNCKRSGRRPVLGICSRAPLSVVRYPRFFRPMKRTRPVAAAAAESPWPASSDGSPRPKSGFPDFSGGTGHRELLPLEDISPLALCSQPDSDTETASLENRLHERSAGCSVRGAVRRGSESQEGGSSPNEHTPPSRPGRRRGAFSNVLSSDRGSRGEPVSSRTRRTTSGRRGRDSSTDESSLGGRPRGKGKEPAPARCTLYGRPEAEKRRLIGPEEAEGSGRTASETSMREDSSSVKNSTRRRPPLADSRGTAVSDRPSSNGEDSRRGPGCRKRREGPQPVDAAGLQLSAQREPTIPSDADFGLYGERIASREASRFLPPSNFGIEAVFQNSAREGRLRLRWIVLENFKSYRGTHVVGPLTSSVGIVGPNGAGEGEKDTGDGDR